jgi:hypothetical protein
MSCALSTPLSTRGEGGAPTTKWAAKGGPGAGGRETEALAKYILSHIYITIAIRSDPAQKTLPSRRDDIILKNSTMGMSAKGLQLPSSAGTVGGSQEREQKHFVSFNVRKGYRGSDPGKRGRFLPIRIHPTPTNIGPNSTTVFSGSIQATWYCPRGSPERSRSDRWLEKDCRGVHWTHQAGAIG